jgi:Family of unknown function (DUF6459)
MVRELAKGGQMHHPDRSHPQDRSTELLPGTGTNLAPLTPTDSGQRTPELRPWAMHLAQAVAEVLAGARIAGQLCDVASLDVLRLLQRGAGRLGARPGAPSPRPVVGSVHISQPCSGVAEACAVVTTGVRVRALALRLERVDDRWQCTALHVG